MRSTKQIVKRDSVTTPLSVEYHAPGSNFLPTVSFTSRNSVISVPASEVARAIRDLIGPTTVAVRDVLDETISGFVQLRDFLGLQLDHAWGNVTDEDFERRAEPFLSAQESGDPANLKDKIRILKTWSSVVLDAETLSAIFRRPMIETETALAEVRSEIRLSAHG